MLSKVHLAPSITQRTSFESILISSYLRLGLPKGFYPPDLPTKTMYAFLYSSLCATFPAHLSRFDLRFLIMLGEE